MPYLHGYFGYDESEFVPNKFLLYMHMVWRYPGARELSCFRWGCGTSSGQRYRQKFGNSRRNAEEALSKIKLQIVAEEFIPLEERQRREAFQRQPILFEDFALDEFLPWSTIQHSPSITPGKPPTGPPNPPTLWGCTCTKSRPSGPRTFNRYTIPLGVTAEASRPGLSIPPPSTGSCAGKGPGPQGGRVGARCKKPRPGGLRPLRKPPSYPGLWSRRRLPGCWRSYPATFTRWSLVPSMQVCGGRSCSTCAGRTSTGRPGKNYESRRIPMNEALVEALQRHPRRLDSPCVCCNRDGHPYEDIPEPLKLGRTTGRNERPPQVASAAHAFCSHTLMQGIDARTVQKWMGIATRRPPSATPVSHPTTKRPRSSACVTKVITRWTPRAKMPTRNVSLFGGKKKRIAPRPFSATLFLSVICSSGGNVWESNPPSGALAPPQRI